MRRLGVLPLVLAAALAAAPAASPVQIDNCRLQYVPGAGDLGILAKSSGLLRIKFTNESAKPATIIRFAVDVEGKEASIRDVGTFAPGLTIEHSFKDFAGKRGLIFGREAQPKCRVTSVKFADGTTWEPEAAAAPSPSPSPSP